MKKKYKKIKSPYGAREKNKQPDKGDVHLFHNTHYSYSHKYVPEKHKIKREVFNKLNKFIFSQVADGLLDERDGVYLEDFGYFFNFMTPKQRYYMSNIKDVGAYGRAYYPMFRAVGRNNPLSQYHIPYLAEGLRRRLQERLKAGQYYTFNLSMLQHKKVEELYKDVIVREYQKEQKRIERISKNVESFKAFIKRKNKENEFHGNVSGAEGDF